jgi:hypothetical protein
MAAQVKPSVQVKGHNWHLWTTVVTSCHLPK